MFDNSEKIFVSPDDLETTIKFNIIHFNDIYNIESREIEPVGGASRFVSAIEYLIQNKPNSLVLFSGDALSPSLISMVVKGSQMIEILNRCHLACACLGNHDFDFGVDVLITSVENSTFPWILSNVFDAETKKPLGNVQDRLIIQISDFKIGLIGLVEEEWMSTLSTISYDEIDYESYITAGKRLANELKNEQNCDFVIALTHMRWNNDTILANGVPEIDLFLGGHDHDYKVQNINNKWVVKSGTDFRDLTLIEITNRKKQMQINKIERLQIVSSIEEHSEIKAIVDGYIERCNEGLNEVIGYINVDLDGRFSQIRTRETNLGNFICDILLNAVRADCALINSGSLRSDQIHKAGEFKMKDLRKILPFFDESVVIEVTGSILHQMLENGVSKYPNHDGRFLQSSGISFSFDPSLPSGSRINPSSVHVQDTLIDLEKKYLLATKEYLYNGKDGFGCLIDCPVIIPGEDIPVLSNLVINHFKEISQLKMNKSQRLRSSIIPLVAIERLLSDTIIEEKLHNDTFSQTSVEANNNKPMSFLAASTIVTKLNALHSHVIGKEYRKLLKKSESYKALVESLEKKALDLSPTCENRIICFENSGHDSNQN